MPGVQLPQPAIQPMALPENREERAIAAQHATGQGVQPARPDVDAVHADSVELERLVAIARDDDVRLVAEAQQRQAGSMQIVGEAAVVIGFRDELRAHERDPHRSRPARICSKKSSAWARSGQMCPGCQTRSRSQ